jgi:UDP-4-keto-D-QuiNAc 4-reductase
MTPHRPAELPRILVTGSRGFIGTHLCRMLAESGRPVMAASRGSGRGTSIPGVTDLRLTFQSDPAAWRRALDSVCCVIHLAARVHRQGADGKAEELFERDNVEATRFVATQAAEAGVRRFIFLSSIKVNGEGQGLTPYRADDPPMPSDAYARSKLRAEQCLRELCGRLGMELVIIRPPLVYGPGVRANFHRLMTLASLGLPLPFRQINNRRSLVSVWNLGNFIQTCITHPGAPGETWLISDGEDLSTPELFRRLTRLMRRSDRMFPVSATWLRRLAGLVGLRTEMNRLCDSLVLDSTPAAQRLRWRPTMSVNDGLARTVDAYRARRSA